MTDPLKLVFLDTETTGLSLDDDVWEIAAIKRIFDADGNVQERELHLFLEHDPAKCSNLPERFLKDHMRRFPAMTHSGRWSGEVVPRETAAVVVQRFTDGAHIVGAVPNFDTERLAKLIRDHGKSWQPPAWHYHLIDVENLALGWLAAKGIAFPLPWRSDDLAALCGIPPVDEADRHTAMGDARWVRDWYDAIMGDAHPEVAE